MNVKYKFQEIIKTSTAIQTPSATIIPSIVHVYFYEEVIEEVLEVLDLDLVWPNPIPTRSKIYKAT